MEDKKKKKPIKYKTRRESLKWGSIVPLIMGVYGVVVVILCCISFDGDIELIILNLMMAVIGIGFFTYCWTYNIKRKKFYSKGIKHQANIIAAEVLTSARGEDSYYMIIEFFVGEKRMIRKTKAYVGSPNFKLKSKRCSIYELDGKYLEGGFRIKEKEFLDVRIVRIYKYHWFDIKGKRYL